MCGLVTCDFFWKAGDRLQTQLNKLNDLDKNDPALLTREALAEKLMVSTDTIKRWTKNRTISVIKIKHVHRYHLKTVLADLKQYEQPAR